MVKKKLVKFPLITICYPVKTTDNSTDMAIRVNKKKEIFTGGELIELQDSDPYLVSSFNSTIPTRKKRHIKSNNKR